MIRLSRWVQRLIKRRVKNGEYVPTLTGFMTVDGPEPGTIWLMSEFPESMPFEIESFDRTHVKFSDGGKAIKVTEFVRAVREGEYVLIGTRPPAISHTAY